MNLFDSNRFIKEDAIKSERASVVSDILEAVNSTHGIRKKLTAKNCAVFLSHIKTPDLYHLLSKMKTAKSPAAIFWYFVKPKK